jgi:hypothetical protein
MVNDTGSGLVELLILAYFLFKNLKPSYKRSRSVCIAAERSGSAFHITKLCGHATAGEHDMLSLYEAHTTSPDSSYNIGRRCSGS